MDLKMNELRIYLAFRDSEGVTNQAAMAEVVRAYNENKSLDEKALAVSDATCSRIKNGRPVKRERKALICQGIKLALEKSNKKTKSDQSLQDYLKEIELQEAVRDKLLEYNQKTKKKHPNKTLTKRPLYGNETDNLLLGVWQQINFTCIHSQNVMVPQLRFSLRMFYYGEHEIKTRSIGVTTDWDGVAKVVNQNLHFSEDVRDRPYGELAHYVYNRHPITAQHDLKILHGFVQVVSHNQHKHIFSGANILWKIDDLTNKYHSDFERFELDRVNLGNCYCGHVKESDLDSTKIITPPDLKSIVETYLKKDGRYRFDIM
jgi:hypothetical protein